MTVSRLLAQRSVPFGVGDCGVIAIVTTSAMSA
jgi:hypothetical protein